jgi:hypothetical protein
MAQYTNTGDYTLQDNLNYLLSGPSGLGQNFAGFNAYTDAYLTGSFRQPFTVPITTTPAPSWYGQETITGITVIDGRTISVSYAATATPPFNQGDTVFLSGVDPDFYNGYYVSGVVSSTTTDTVLQTQQSYTWPAYVSGGTINKNYSTFSTDDDYPYYQSTDCNARVTVYGPTDRVFVSAQLQLDFTFNCTTASTFKVGVAINRYRGRIDLTRPRSGDYLFDYDGTVTAESFDFSASTSGSDALTAIFTSAVDVPTFGYYWYILELYFEPVTGDVTPDVFTAGLRALSAQAVRQ